MGTEKHSFGRAQVRNHVKIFFLMILCLAAIRFFGPADAVETEKRYDTTVMVYLCGSNHTDVQ